MNFALTASRARGVLPAIARQHQPPSATRSRASRCVKATGKQSTYIPVPFSSKGQNDPDSKPSRYQKIKNIYLHKLLNQLPTLLLDRYYNYNEINKLPRKLGHSFRSNFKQGHCQFQGPLSQCVYSQLVQHRRRRRASEQCQ